MRLAFLATPEFALPALRAVVAAGHDVTLVVTQPDKARGRGRRLQPTPVRRLATELQLATEVLARGQREAVYHRILQDGPDVVVVVAFGHIVREPLLHGPMHGCLNVHASLLPRWRGPAPIHRAILAGDTVSGVSTMRLAEGVDTGPVYLQRSTPIGPEETAGELHDRLAVLGAQALVDTLTGLQEGTLAARPQEDSGITHAPLLKKEEGTLDFQGPARVAHDRIRGLTPWPGVTVRHGDRSIRLTRSRVASAQAPPDVTGAAPGTVVAIGDEAFLVACAEGTLQILEVQPAGRHAMRASDYARGYRLAAGDRLRPVSSSAVQS